MNRIPKKALILLFVWILVFSSQNVFCQKRPKIGLVLDGGGALGLAHLGTLRLLDKYQIPVDYVVGTSMGGLVAALYSMGYSGEDIQEMAEDMDWKSLFSDVPQRSYFPFFQKRLSGKYQFDFRADGLVPSPPSGLIYGQNISLFFTAITTPYEDLEDFDQLPIPFRCVAVDLISGKEIVLKKGSLAKAMRATMSIPTLFTPVEWKGHLLIDGGLLNNLPVDVARDMGADIVIAVDIQKPLLKQEELDSAFRVLEQSIKIAELSHSSENAKQADFLIRPDLRAYNMFDFFFKDKLKGIIRAGDQAAEQSWPQLKQMLIKQNVYKQEPVSSSPKPSESAYIHTFQIKGSRTIPYEEIKKSLDLEKGQLFQKQALKEKLIRLKTNFRLKNLETEIIPLSSKEVKLILYLEEEQAPVIQNISISGNVNLPSSFIRRLLGLKKGSRFNELSIIQKIMKIYSLRYFTHIQYKIDHLGANKIDLKLWVKESKENSFHLGLRYDDRYKIVGLAAFNANNVLFPGLRSENELQFMGLTQFHSTLFYPTRSFDVPAYPYVSLEYRNRPVHIYDGTGDIPLTYKDRGVEIGLGLGFLISNVVNSEIGIHQEFLNLRVNSSASGPVYFPDLNDSLCKVCASFTIDTLDAVLLPSKGVYLKADYQGSFKNLGSEKEYQRLGVSTDIYNTYHDHTVRFSGFLGLSSGSLPLYKFFNQSTPFSFVGMDYDQVFVNRIKTLRIDYRYRFNDLFHIQLISNIAFDVEKRLPNRTFKSDLLWGLGAGVLFNSPLGTAEVIYGLGSKSFDNPRKAQDILYITLGTRF
ncbi:MAG: BamA/TamA family outer membrane protein [Candidatus Aminicenantes bacterium]|nr:BamA/TamA family outer membrane protein [Candidatus Aminicenantes bacterium]